MEQLLLRLFSPLLGILAGAIFTAIIQSSSASVGILQALAMSGLIGLDGAVFVLFGQNIGTCITAVLASIGTGRNAKRTTIIHLLFNVIGTTLFLVICLTTPFIQAMVDWIPNNPAVLILPDKKAETTDVDRWFDGVVSSQHVLGASSIVINEWKVELKQMMHLAYDNVNSSFVAIEHHCAGGIEGIEAVENQIDKMNHNLSQKVSRIFTLELARNDVEVVNHIFKIIGNIERIGDHAMNLAEYAQTMNGMGLELSDEALKEIQEMRNISLRALKSLVDIKDGDAMRVLGQEMVLEQSIDDTTVRYRQNQIARLRQKACNPETAIFYTEILTDYERIGDHILNIAEEYSGCEN